MRGDQTKQKIQRMIEFRIVILSSGREAGQGNEEGTHRQIRVIECIILWLSADSWIFTTLL